MNDEPNTSNVAPEKNQGVKDFFADRALVFCVLTLVIGLGGLSSLFLAKLWLAFDILSHFTMQFFILTVAGLIAMTVSRAKVFTVIAVIFFGVAALGGMARFNTSPDQFSSINNAPDLKNFRVMSFNTWAVNHDWQAVMAEINRNDPDVVGMVEFTSIKKPMLAALKAKYPYQVDCQNQRHCNMVILSKIAVLESKARTSWVGPPIIMAKLAAANGPLTVYLLHTLRPPHYRSQMKQIIAAANLIAKTPGRKIAMGDFNATPFSRNLSEFQARSHMRRLTGTPSWPSYFMNLPQIAIDHIYVSEDIGQVIAGRIGHNAGSDHYPVIATVNLAK